MIVAVAVGWTWRNPPSVFGADPGSWWIVVRQDLRARECRKLEEHLRLVMRYLEEWESRDAAFASIAYKRIVCRRGKLSGHHALFLGPFSSQARASSALIELRELSATRFVFRHPHYLRRMYPTRASR